jgi:hypothetical protein
MIYNTYPYETVTALQRISTPTVDMYHGRKVYYNKNADADGFRLNRINATASQDIPVEGVTIMAMVRPIYYGSGNNWQSIVDFYYSDLRLQLARHNGMVGVYRKGNWQDVAQIPDGQLTIVTLVLQTNGAYKVWFNAFNNNTGTFDGEVLKKDQTTALGAFTFFDAMRDNLGHQTVISIGKGWDGWATMNGYLGDVFVYKTALNDAERLTLQADFTNELNRTIYKVTSTTSGAGGGTIVRAGAASGTGVDWYGSEGVVYTAVTPRWDSALAQVVVNGTPLSVLPTFPYTNNPVSTTTIDFVFNKAANRTITGTVYDLSSNPVTNATVKLRGEANGLPWEEYTVSTDASGNYSLVFPNGPCFLVAAKDGYIPSTEQAVTVLDGISTRNFYITAGRNFPKMEYMLFGLDTALLGSVGASANWPLLYNTLPSFVAATEAVRVGTGTPIVRELYGSKFSENDRSQTAIQGYQIGGNVAGGSMIPVNGVTAVSVFRHKRGTGGDNTHVLNIFDHNFAIIVEHGNGQLKVSRNGGWSNIVQIPDGQLTMVSVVMNTDGTYKVWVRPYVPATDSFTNLASPTYTQTGTSTFTAFWHTDNDRRIRIGMNNWSENWSEFDGYIGEQVVYRTAFTNDAERLTLEQTVAERVCTVPKYTVLTTVTGTGTVNPSGSTKVMVGNAINYTYTAGSGKYLSDILTNSVSIGGANVPTIGSWSYTPSTNMTVEFVFVDTPSSWNIQGRVTDSVTGLAITNATVSVITNKYSLPVSAVYTDVNGDYTLAGTYSSAVSVAVSATGYMIQHGTVNFPGYGSFALVPTGRNIPKMEYLFYGFSTDALGAVGSSADWKMMYTTHPGYADLWNATAVKQNTPSVASYRGVKFSNVRGLTANDGFRLTDVLDPIPLTNGATIVSVVRRQVDGGGDNGWTSIVSFFHTVFGWETRNFTGQVRAWRYGDFANSGYQVPDGQVVLVSIVYQANGNYKIWKRVRNPGDAAFSAPTVEYYTNTGTADMTSIRPGGGAHEKALWLGRGWDGWQAFKGGLGDTFVYKTALTDEERLTIESDIVAKYDGVSTHKVTSSATAGGTPTISAGGMTFGMGDEYYTAGDITYTFNCAWNKIIGEVKVNGSAIAPTPSGATWTLTVDGAKTVEITYIDKPGARVSGQITDASTGFPLANASVYFKPGTTAPATYQFQVLVTADTNGNYSVVLPNGPYKVAASAAGYAVSPDTNLTVVVDTPADQDFGLTKNGKFVPQMNKLLFAAYADGIRPSDKNWELLYPYGLVKAPMGTIDLVTDVGQWYINNNDPRYNGYNVLQLLAPEPCNGFTAMAVFKPIAHPGGDNNWQSVIDMCYSRFCLIVNRTTMRLRIRSNDRWNDSVFLQEGVKYVLSVVTQPTGQYKVYTNGVEVMDVTSTSDWTTIQPGQNTGGSIGGFDSWITIGRNAPDGWTTCNGNIAAALVWKDMLSSTERETLEQDLLARYRDGTFIVKALVAGEGLVSGAGSVTPASTVVSSGGSVSYTITRDKCKQIKSIRVNGALIPNVEGATAYTVENVTQDTTVEFLFKDSPAGLKITIY